MFLQKIKILEPKELPISLMPNEFRDELSILWNIGECTTINIDGETVTVDTNCIIFVSEFFMKLETNSTDFRLIQFNKIFLNPFDSDLQANEYLMIFYGMHAVDFLPKITLKAEELPLFETTWENLILENEQAKNPVMESLLRNSFQRFLLLCNKIHMETKFDVAIDFKDLRVVRQFQHLVNTNFKELTKVSEYAEILKISPKKISELFGCCYDRKASELIADRRNLYAKRQLIYSDELIKNIAYDLNFSDSQTFSHFFKKQNGLSPDEFRQEARNK
ncbi:MAG: hypothetical protein COA38_13390 [Fluviicola sp.]|nr:MAG: hypothetical protein COA38_13390 [Fluviicola sp.]